MAKTGDRVELIACSDPYTKLEPGDRGTVSFVDSMGTTHVQWDSGSNLGMIAGHDSFRVVAEAARADDEPREPGGPVGPDGQVYSDADPGL